MRKTFKIMISMVMIVCLLLTTAAAYETPYGRWRYTSVSYNFGTSMSSTYRDVWENAISSWNDAQSQVSLYQGSGTSGSIICSTINDTSSSDYGYTYRGRNETTYYMTATVSYLNLNNSAVAAGGLVCRSTACHELGHSLGLNHFSSTTVSAVMNTSRNRSSIYTPKSDDINAINYAYTATWG